ncbi:hypothetical protein QPK13_00330 [Photorhabdus tasmaniensis]|uniref:2,3-diaminopropionate biosynthesis protein SbnB n=1 Tax=Photorhabdus tasmaniensis TaxID=1004159 RepID=A0ABX0GM72_9GAMM|nr:2,3-diaminopropionate biosynthesis protein SbnB [Photorhabdus tasmaniensis]NHB89316.1 2,3-diaminopropionate biosynthesis protein SbnB [Photorhabdus tasmaniensis]
MRLIREKDVELLCNDWDELVSAIKEAIFIKEIGEYSQPLKPYLRCSDPTNRIIAMPSWVGGDINKAGIKWIASFPKNITKGLPRANSITILNDIETGIPCAIVLGAAISSFRTAAVSLYVLKQYMESWREKKINVGIIGFGPIGVTHYRAISSLSYRVGSIKVHDIKSSKLAELEPNNRETSLKRLLANSDVVITCTPSKSPYIYEKPKKGSLHLNVSLRDYSLESLKHFDKHIVDDWMEVCREGTNIENMHQAGQLAPEQVSVLSIVNSCLNMKNGKTVMFSPMGMSIFDIAIANYVLKKAEESNIGVCLDEL